MIKLSNDALVFGYAYFAQKGSTLSFGGDHAVMEITPRARAALDELIASGVVVEAEPQDQWPSREHYRSSMAVAPMLKGRKDLSPFGDEAESVFGWDTFVKREGAG